MTAEITEIIFRGNVYDIEERLRENLMRGIPAMDLLNAMMAGLEKCGEMFEVGQYFLPELMMSGEAFKSGMQVLAPHLADVPRQMEGTVLLGTVQGDIHDIGKNLVGFMLESSGFKVIDIGVDVSADRFASAVQEHAPDVLGLSALLTTTMLGMRDVLESLRQAGLRERVKVILGGAPVSRRFAEEIGADAYASDASQGVRKIRTLIQS
jgi:5-methyltetrahydrofolate--homocysteine methyltransferase